tara:strand:- start:1195 stop:2172 length:978 start_codon:yes stop_codon:yes gene_type:complete
MKNNLIKKKNSEKLIINNYLKKLNLGKRTTYNFENDGAYIEKNNKRLVVTTDSISENIDFFKNDSPKSIANKIITINLSDLCAMGVYPYTYTLNLFLPDYIDKRWLTVFTNELLRLQKKYKFYLLGGDLSKSDKLILTSTFFGYSKKIIAPQNNMDPDNDIWITGNIGDSFIGLQILRKKINIKNRILKKYFLNKYYYPKPQILGPKIINFIQSMKDISDGFITDLNKMLNNTFGAQIFFNKLPFSSNMNKLIKSNKIIKSDIINNGDDYELIIISKKINRYKIQKLAKIYKIKITRVGKITKNKLILDDSNNLINNVGYYNHFS